MYGGYPKYVSVAEKKSKALKFIAKLRKTKKNVSPVIIEGRKITKTWWGNSWNKNLEKYSDFSNRVSRGRSYVTHGCVVDLQISSKSINALVLGSRRTPYDVEIIVKPLDKKTWKSITDSCKGKIDTLSELIEGKFPKSLTELFTSKGDGLFPSPEEISFTCNCPDSAGMCKHIAATLYGVGARLDKDPKLFFELRDVSINDIITIAIEDKSNELLEKAEVKSKRVIEDPDLFDMFDLE